MDETFIVTRVVQTKQCQQSSRVVSRRELRYKRFITMPHCRTCGGRLRRIHRSFVERFFYMGVFECPQCKDIKRVARRFTYHLGEEARCPLCGTFRLRVLAEKDHIDRMLKNPVNVWQRWMGGKIFHCRYCRVQFYDRRRLAEQEVVKTTIAS